MKKEGAEQYIPSGYCWICKTSYTTIGFPVWVVDHPTLGLFEASTKNFLAELLL